MSGLFWDRTEEFKPGAFGCYLSHAECWQRVVDGTNPYALVVEDDILIHPQAIENFGLDASLDSFDVIYVNRRVFSWATHFKSPGRFETLPPLLTGLICDGTYGKGIPVPGTDGYIVSKKGASKLLEMMHSRKISMGVDYAMILNTLTAEEIARLESVGPDNLPFSLRCFLSSERRLPGHDPISLNSYVYTEGPLVELADFESTIQHTLLLPNTRFERPRKRLFQRIQGGFKGCSK